MPEKISIKQMRQWLELFESGRTIDAIAHKFGRDVRTIKSGIERARRDRSAEAVRTGMMTDAIKQHQVALLNTVGEIISGLETGADRFAALARYSDVSVFATLPGEATPYWELLRQHLPRDPLWDFLNRRKKAVMEFAGTCTELRNKTDQLLVQKCRCAIVENDGRPPFLFTTAPEIIYAEVLYAATDQHPRTDIHNFLQIDVKSGQVMLAHTVLAVAPGSEEEFAGYIREVLHEIDVSEEAARLPGKYRAMLDAKEKTRRAAEEIVLVGMVTGLCRICRRLGL